MTQSLSGFGIDHEIKLSKHAARVLAGNQELPRAGYGVLLRPSWNKESALESGALEIQNVFGTMILASGTHTRDQWPEAFNIDSETGLPLADYQPGTSMPVRKTTGDFISYRNGFYDPKDNQSRETFGTCAKPEEYRGYLIFHRIDPGSPVERGEHVFDIVKPEPITIGSDGHPVVGVCVGQVAGPSGAKLSINAMIEKTHHLLSTQHKRLVTTKKPDNTWSVLDDSVWCVNIGLIVLEKQLPNGWQYTVTEKNGQVIGKIGQFDRVPTRIALESLLVANGYLRNMPEGLPTEFAVTMNGNNIFESNFLSMDLAKRALIECCFHESIPTEAAIFVIEPDGRQHDDLLYDQEDLENMLENTKDSNPFLVAIKRGMSRKP